MPDYREMFDSDYLRAIDLRGKSHVVKIEKVEAGKLTQAGGKKKRMPVLYFRGHNKPMGCNATNCKSIKALYGKFTEDWVGKDIEIYPTTTTFGAEKDVDCIRVRPPRGAAPAVSESKPALPDRCEDGRCGVCSWCVAVARDLEGTE